MIYQIGVCLFKNENLNLFLLYYLVFEAILFVLKESSITKIIIQVCFKGK